METKRFSGRVELKAEPAGEFTAIISTFNKRDKWGDIVRPGAFAATIAAWRAKGVNVPVVFAHQSEDPDKHIGHVAPEDLQETSIGLQARGQFYLEEPVAAKVFKQLQRKALSEWSFGYIIAKAKALAQGGRELLEVSLLELGPCLAGVGDTTTLEVKAERPTGIQAQQQELTRVQLAPFQAELDLAIRRAEIARALAR